MKRNKVVFALSIVLALTAFKVISAEEAGVAAQAEASNAKSVAWYVANIRAARDKNQVCHDNPETKASEDCNNALHALLISFNGAN
ncbi:MAG: hypothetical protein KGZ80_11665 [Methylomonas sp.]|nr:hypothetical protein [Methylomonas sp.]PPD20437.1 MAG: hypothetical protein CTY23_08685 [Methylomonas sp.]PPD26703.1 MAG: hypothetical protein CTY22_04265 [Methylomonas sp.]PPD38523.1 MAG: hypothetical protein CTY21_04265 [Methylomonas sp.]PPD40162.1 MAG: hypothetical protein CTY17_07145 [Methylomonas sp.]